MTSSSHLEELEMAVWLRRHGEIVEKVGAACSEIAQEARRLVQAGLTEEKEAELTRRFSRAAAAIFSLFSDPSFELSPRQFYRLQRHREEIATLIVLSGFQSADHFLRALFARGVNCLTASQAMKFATCCTYESEFAELLHRLWPQNPQLFLPSYLSLLGAQPVLTERCFALWQALLDDSAAFATAKLESPWLGYLKSAWMICSYDDRPRKHDIKIQLNRLVQDWLARENLRPPPLLSPRPRKQRPTLIVVAERFFRRHVMFRAYASALRQLRTRFRLELVVDRQFVDEPAAELFEEVTRLDVGQELPELLRGLLSKQPDVVFFPSLGMHLYSIALANLRWAPIQFVSTGHPATTCSPYVDYMLLGREVLGAPECFTETVVTLRGPGHIYENPPEIISLPPKIRPHPHPLRVAVVSKVLKLNARFMALCKRIADNSARPVEFHFFPDVMGLRYLHCRRQIRSWLPTAFVYPTASFADYIARLNEMDVRLGSFPFSGALSTMDCLRQAIPTVAMLDDQPHGRIEAMFMRLVGCPEWLITHSEAEYEAAAHRLIHNDQERVQIARHLVSCGVDRILFDEYPQRNPTDMVDTVWWIYQNHEAIQAAHRKVWHFEDRTLIPSP